MEEQAPTYAYKGLLLLSGPIITTQPGDDGSKLAPSKILKWNGRNAKLRKTFFLYENLHYNSIKCGGEKSFTATKWYSFSW